MDSYDEPIKNGKLRLHVYHSSEKIYVEKFVHPSSRTDFNLFLATLPKKATEIVHLHQSSRFIHIEIIILSFLVVIHK